MFFYCISHSFSFISSEVSCVLVLHISPFFTEVINPLACAGTVNRQFWKGNSVIFTSKCLVLLYRTFSHTLLHIITFTHATSYIQKHTSLVLKCQLCTTVQLVVYCYECVPLYKKCVSGVNRFYELYLHMQLYIGTNQTCYKPDAVIQLPLDYLFYHYSTEGSIQKKAELGILLHLITPTPVAKSDYVILQM